MMTTLIAGGDSYTWGSELPDCHDKEYSRLTWSALFSQKKQYEYVCVASPGASNSCISRLTIKHVNSYFNKDKIFVAVMWTLPFRYEIQTKNKKSNDGWNDLSLYQGLTFEERKKIVHPVDSWHEEKLLNQFNADKASGIYDLSQVFYNCIDYSFLNYETLKNIFLTQSFLKEKNIDYVFAASTTHVLDIINSDNFIGPLIDRSKWLNLDIGFTEWTAENKYKLCPMNHPPAEAHSDWINYYGDKL